MKPTGSALKVLKRCAAMGSLSVLLGANLAAAAELTDISYQILPGDKIELRLDLDEAVEPKVFTTDNPARIALDFASVNSALKQKTTSIGVGATRSVTAVEAGGRTRVVVNLVEMVPYSTRMDGDDYVMTLGGGSGTASTSNQSSATASSNAASGSSQPTSQAASTKANGIYDLDFRRGPDGTARIQISLSNPNTPIDLRQEGKKVVADFSSVPIKDSLVRRVDVTDFATPAQTIATSRRGDGVRMVVDTEGEFEYLAYQADNQLTIELKPLTKAEVERRKLREPEYTGERMSLNFQNIQVRSVLQLIADFTGLNMVTSDSVDGEITLRLQNVPWDQALDIILKSKGLAKRQNGNVLMIAPAEEIAAREKLELQAEQVVEELAPLRTEFIQVNYAKAESLAEILKAEDNRLMSERGNVTVDERTNTLLVMDTARKLDEIRSMIETLDVPVRQVEIQSRIVTADDGFAQDLGVRFGFSDSNSESGISGSLEGAEDMREAGDASLFDRLNVNLPANPATANAGVFGLNIARLSDGIILDLELSALESENRGEVIATPRVITANQSEAYIEAGEEIPYLEATSAGATKITFKKAVLSLKVKPQITPDDRIVLDLQVNQDTRGVDTPIGPAIDTQEVGTQVLVDNGETIVLGGIYQQRTNINVAKVPFLGDLPGVGWLFRQRTRENRKQELLIFVTPKIIKETLN